MTALGLSPFGRLAGIAPLVLRLLLGVVMLAHGYLKITAGPARFGQTLAALGVPAPELVGYVVTITEVAGGILLLLGLLSRVAALALAIEMVFAILLVKIDVGLITVPRGDAGAELDLALLAGFLAIALAGPGRLSLDRAIGLERRRTAEGSRLDLAAIGRSADGLGTAGRPAAAQREVTAEPVGAPDPSPVEEPATAEHDAPTAAPEGPVPQSDEREPQLETAVTGPGDVATGTPAEPKVSPAPRPAASFPPQQGTGGVSAAQRVRERPGLAIAAGVAAGLLIRSALRRR